jgi:hypothetical protein
MKIDVIVGNQITKSLGDAKHFHNFHYLPRGVFPPLELGGGKTSGMMNLLKKTTCSTNQTGDLSH